jgi:shikimate kinase
VDNSRLIAPWVDMAFDLSMEGNFEKAMTLNGFLYCGALGFDTEFLIRALKIGVEGVTLSGTGPSYVALVNDNQAGMLEDAWKDYGVSGNVIRTKVNNAGAHKGACYETA